MSGSTGSPSTKLLAALTRPAHKKTKRRPAAHAGQMDDSGLILKHVYQLSDPQLEDQLTRWLSLRRFAGLPLAERVPDFTTYWRFREALAKQGFVEKLFEQINRQLQAKGLILKQGTMADASIINSTNRSLSDQKRKQLADHPTAQVDTDTTSSCKGGRWQVGYKGHIGLDAGRSSTLSRPLKTAMADGSPRRKITCETKPNL